MTVRREVRRPEYPASRFPIGTRAEREEPAYGSGPLGESRASAGEDSGEVSRPTLRPARSTEAPKRGNHLRRSWKEGADLII